MTLLTSERLAEIRQQAFLQHGDTSVRIYPLAQLFDHIETLQRERDEYRSILVRAINALGGGATDDVSDDFLSLFIDECAIHRRKRDELKAKLASAENECDGLSMAVEAWKAKLAAAERENDILRYNTPKSILRRLEAQDALKYPTGDGGGT